LTAGAQWLQQLGSSSDGVLLVVGACHLLGSTVGHHGKTRLLCVMPRGGPQSLRTMLWQIPCGCRLVGVLLKATWCKKGYGIGAAGVAVRREPDGPCRE
jgi:hypothetical protein